MHPMDDAKVKLQNDRDPKELLFQFKKRKVVFFAVDPDNVYTSTRLHGEGTFFLPFNKGNNGWKSNLKMILTIKHPIFKNKLCKRIA